MSRPDEKDGAVTVGSGKPDPRADTRFRDAMLIVLGFGVATTLTGLVTMGLIEFAQSIGWWDGSGR